MATPDADKHPPVPLLDLQAQYAVIEADVRGALDRVLRTQQFILGPEVDHLEREIAEYSGCRFGIGVSSGTDALLVSLMAIDIDPGDEVITTPYTFFATAGCIARLGARPVFVDIDPTTFNLNPARIESVVTKRTKAIMPVHLYGQMAEMEPIEEIARRRNLHLIEDAAQAIGAEYKGRRAGSIGSLGSFSFFPSKNLGGFGDGGMVATNDAELADRAKALRSHGSQSKYYHKLVGGNFRLDAIQAAVLRVKLTYLDSWTAARQRNAETYHRLFRAAGLGADLGGPKRLILPQEGDSRRHIYNQFVIRVDKNKRNPLMSCLQQNRIGTEVYYPVPLHLQECFAGLGYRLGDFPQSEAAAEETLALPIYPELNETMQAAVVNIVAEFLNG